ncbi:MAG: diguanylate cyclase, partial [Planctomycetota bacterium]
MFTFILFAVGCLLGVLLIGIGVLVGYRWGSSVENRQQASSVAAIESTVPSADAPSHPGAASSMGDASETFPDSKQELRDALVRAHQQIQEYQQQALTDILTGLVNRRALVNALESDANVASLVMLDIDRFKRINDSLGHHGGDSVLCSVAQLLQEHFEDAIALARFGGDEFALLLRDGVQTAASRIDLVRKLAASKT